MPEFVPQFAPLSALLCRSTRIVAAFLVVALVPGLSAAGDGQMQMLFVGAAPEAGLESGLTGDMPVIAIDVLPEAGDVEQEVFAARLRANPVSTFVDGPSEQGKQFDQFFLVAQAALDGAVGDYRLSLGRGQFSVADFAGRLESAVQAFDPKHRRAAFLHVADAAGVFPKALPELRGALNALSFDMVVLMVGGTACDGAQPLHYSVALGLADRVPFGDGDGVSTMAEVERYLTAALTRADLRACGPAYSLILKSTDDPAYPLVAAAGVAQLVEIENRLYHETFEAMFLMESQDVDNVHAFLESCVYCPNEDALRGRLAAMEEARRTAALEAGIWERIRGDDSRERLAIYLANCVLCAFEDAARERIGAIDAKSAARDREDKDFIAASGARDLAALRDYAENCVACAHEVEAASLIAEIETDSAYRTERAMLAEAVQSRDPARLAAYLSSCTICDGQDEIARMQAMLARLEALRAPCLAVAGLPQFGGPRKLEDIDRTEALRLCGAAADEFPEDGLLRTTLGRIAQAAGDTSAASAAYEFGIAQDTPAAYGLAAYSFYAPEDGSPIDLARVEALASAGADRGDWLSQEILTVIYSKDLVPGKTGKDAFDIAARVAEEGNPLAQFFVGYYYLTGTGTEIDEGLAEAWLKKAVDQGYIHANSFLAELHERGADGIAQPDLAANLYWSALEAGDPTATDRLTTQIGNRDREVVRIIQAKLRDAGLYRGRVDGMAGPGTVAAIREYADTMTGQG